MTAKAVVQRHAVVTGASSGIGEAIVQRLLADGWRVTGLCRTPAKHDVEHLTIVPVDVTDFAALRPIVDAIDTCDAFVHAAGFMRTAPLGELTAADGAAMWRLHVDAAAFLANALLPKMSAGGRIVLIGSRTANGAATRSQYAATKAALVGMARSWAAELAPRGITVNVVAPGATDTPLLNDPARAGTPPKLPPIGRFVKPSEVAALTGFLLGADAGAITGQQIVMCGGSSL
ncbi:3-oxoacyl-[acyl-carrier-protein] reductase FabG [Paraburkholderia nemoris]|uniref:SDR family NAD(P)-dependent oxidoreductase n=1 Tax=Paraburkholderia nemoris TaxID=2793076 RepID=UPI001B223F29|nr:SDR family oxidoreductase [Paraburkholderia nemoris]MBK3742399.1 SDR family oxidoreductase [Paraburkholderia aspalathi]CAE6784571.1 3-oxoacyl-[acyl-carrier-protein] reductase FabG [Paraburkholderia nemoris]